MILKHFYNSMLHFTSEHAEFRQTIQCLKEVLQQKENKLKTSSTQSQLLAIETNICLPTASKSSETSVNTDVVFLTSRKLT